MENQNYINADVGSKIVKENYYYLKSLSEMTIYLNYLK